MPEQHRSTPAQTDPWAPTTEEMELMFRALDPDATHELHRCAMKRLLYSEARELKAAGPFSFIDLAGNCATRLNICAQDVITASNCVEPRYDQLIVHTPVMPLYGGAR